MSDEDQEFLVPYLTLVRGGGATPRVHDPREVLNALQYTVKADGDSRPMSSRRGCRCTNKARRELATKVFEAIAITCGWPYGP